MTHPPDILSNLADTNNAACVKEVAAPLIRRSYIVENDGVGGYGSWDYGISGDGVLVERQAGAKCADGREARGYNTAAKVPETHTLIRLLSFEVPGGRLDLYKETGFLLSSTMNRATTYIESRGVSGM